MSHLSIILTSLLMILPLPQENKGGMPDTVFYLQKDFEKGNIYYSDGSRSEGTFNICAIDNSIRFKDKNGTEMSVDYTGRKIDKVVIGENVYVLRDRSFARILNGDTDKGLAAIHEVIILTDVQTGGYGMETNTTSAQTFSSLSADSGRIYLLDEVKNVPYRDNYQFFIYEDGKFYPLNKKSILKYFPEKSSEITAFIEANKIKFNNIEDVTALSEILK